MHIKCQTEYRNSYRATLDRRSFIGATLAGLAYAGQATAADSLPDNQGRKLTAHQINGLELLHMAPRAGVARGRILLIPGAYHGAWAFEDNLLAFLANAGFDTYAMSLRGHGASLGAEHVMSAGFDDYVADVETIAQHLGGSPILIGHSLGGLLIRRVIERQKIRAAVLLATPTPKSMREGALKLLFNFPWAIAKFALSGDPDAIYRDESVVRKLLFNGATDAKSQRALDRIVLEKESKLLVKQVQLLKFQPVNLPLLAIGGTADMGVPVDAIHETANNYRGSTKLIQDAAHEFFLMPGWESSARCISDWLAHQGL